MNTENLSLFISDLVIPGCVVQAGAANNVDTLLTEQNFDSFLAKNQSKDLYFLAGVSSDIGMKRASDKDIKAKGHFFLDFDIRSFWKKAYTEEISDADIQEIGIGIAEAFKGHALLSSWKYFVFSGNGVHFHFVGQPVHTPSPDAWSMGMKSLLKEAESLAGTPPDYNCINLGRICRLPGSYNNKNERHLLVEILESQNKTADIAAVLHRGEELLTQAEEVARSKAEQVSVNIGEAEDTYAAIQKIPIANLVCRLKGWETDNRNFYEPGSKKPKACFVSNGKNVLIHGGTEHFPDTFEGYSPFELVKNAKDKPLSNAETFAWFKEHYPEIDKISRREQKPSLGVPVQPQAEEGRTITPREAFDISTLASVSLEDVLQRTRNLGMVNDYVVETVLSTYISKELGKANPLWLLLVGAPSSNKTQLVTLLRHAPDTLAVDVMTSNPFISGAKQSENPQDLLPQLDGKCFIVKDYTSFFGRSEETVKQLLSDLVSIYDGEFTKHSSSRGTVEYQATFSHIGCVTSEGLKMRQKYMNMVGARFLTMRIPPLTDKQQEDCFDIAWANDLPARFIEASKAAISHVMNVCEKIRAGENLRPMDKSLRKRLNLLAQLIAKARGVIKSQTNTFTNEHGEDVTHTEIADVQIEEPFRALHQLRRLCDSLAHLRGKAEVTMGEVTTARLVALSSMPVNRAEILSVFQRHERVTAKQAAETLNQNHKTTKRHLDELHRLGVLLREKEGMPGITRDDETSNAAWIYSPQPHFKELLLMEGFPNLEV